MGDQTFFSRVKAEVDHWRRKRWSFAEVGMHWDAVEDYDEVNEETYSYFRRFVDGLRLSNIQSGARVLDICARTGNGSLYFSQHGKVGSAICADVSIRMGQICSKRLKEGGFERFLWIPINDYSLPFADEAFDAILCFETVEHFSEPERLVEELGRVSRSNGILIVTTPNVIWEPIHALAAILKYHHSEGPHRFIPNNRLLSMIEKAGFVIEKSETTVLVPGGPKTLIRFGEWIEKHTKQTLMHLLGLRRVFVCKKLL